MQDSSLDFISIIGINITDTSGWWTSGLSELLTLQMHVFMQLLKERNSQHEQLNSLLFDRYNVSLYLKQKLQSYSSYRKFWKRPAYRFMVG